MLNKDIDYCLQCETYYQLSILSLIQQNFIDKRMSMSAIMEPRLAKNQKVSCVLLVCVYDTIVFEITNDLVYSRFHQFGTIVRLLVFEKKEVTKLFVEYETCEQAFKAKQALDGKKLCNNICKMSIYYSTFQNVDLKHQSSQGIEFGYKKSKSQDNNSVETFTNKSMQKNIDDFDQFNAFGYCGIPRFSHHAQQQFTHLHRSKTDINEMNWHINQIRRDQNNWSGLLYIDQTIKSDIDSILNCEHDQSDKWSSNSQTNSSPKKTLSPKLKNQQAQNQILSVIGFQVKHPVKHSNIYNLFSNFGNISMIKLTKNQAFVKFRTAEFAAIAKNYLSNTWLFNNKIEIASCLANHIQPQEGEYCEIISYDETTDRFTTKKSITINPPSKVLHVSSLKKEKCTVGEISNIFKFVVQPQRVKILKQSADKNMALVEFSSLEDSFDAISQCHNMLVGGRKIQISFTKSQI